MIENYVVSQEARKSAARAWGKFWGKIDSFDKETEISFFEELKSIDEHFYEYNVCKLLAYRKDSDVALFNDSKFGPTQAIIGHCYRKGKGVEENISLAKSHYKLGAIYGNIICRVKLISMDPTWKKILSLPLILFLTLKFAYTKNKNEYDTRTLY